MKNFILNKFWSFVVSAISIVIMSVFIAVDYYIQPLSFINITNIIFGGFPLLVFLVNFVNMFVGKKKIN
jgi:hypothetical protein